MLLLLCLSVSHDVKWKRIGSEARLLQNEWVQMEEGRGGPEKSWPSSFAPVHKKLAPPLLIMEYGKLHLNLYLGQRRILGHTWHRLF